MDCFIRAPNNTLAHYIYYRLANKNKPCYLLDGDQFLTFNRNEIAKHRFMVGPSINMERTTGVAQNIFERNIFFNDKPFFETLRVFYLSKKLSEGKLGFINLCISTLFTHGFFLKLVRDVRLQWVFIIHRTSNPNWLLIGLVRFSFFLKMPDLHAVKRDVRFKTYLKLNDYIADFTIISDLKLEDLSFVFNAYSVGLLIILLLFLLHHLTVWHFSFTTFVYGNLFRLFKKTNLVATWAAISNGLLYLKSQFWLQLTGNLRTLANALKLKKWN